MIAIRPLAVDDWAAFKAARLRALTSAPGSYFASAADVADWTDADWQALLCREDARLFGAFDGDRLVGTTGVFTDGDDASGAAAKFGMTWLDPSARGQGIAHRYHAIRLDWARRRGFTKARVSHRASNLASRRAILAAGFVPVGVRSYDWPDGVTEDDVLYELELA